MLTSEVGIGQQTLVSGVRLVPMDLPTDLYTVHYNLGGRKTIFAHLKYRCIEVD